MFAYKLALLVIFVIDVSTAVIFCLCDSVACVVDKLNPAASAGSDDSANISVPDAYDTRDITVSIRDAIRAKSTRTSRVYFRNFAVGELIKRAVREFKVPTAVPRDPRFVETRLGR